MAASDFLNLLDRTFPRQHDEIAAQLAGKLHASRARHRHLRRGVNREVRREASDEPADAHVLHDGCIDSRRNDGAKILFSLNHLILEDERVERDVTLHAAPVQELHQLRQIGLGEIVRAHPGVELLQAEVNRVRPVLHRRLRALPIARRREQFGQPHAFAPGRGRSRRGRWRANGTHATAEPSSRAAMTQSLFARARLSV